MDTQRLKEFECPFCVYKCGNYWCPYTSIINYGNNLYPYSNMYSINIYTSKRYYKEIQESTEVQGIFKFTVEQYRL